MSEPARTEQPRHRRAALSYCAQQVREHDPERYLATLFAPAAAREGLFALYAFDHEIAKVRHVVSEPMAGLIRWQWWREALDGIAAGAPRAHPVVHALVAAFQSSALSRARLDAAIDAREAELADPPADLAALERRLDAACGGITLGATEVLGDVEGRSHDAARRVGLALGIVRLMQSLPRDLQRNRVLLPVATLVRAGVDPQDPGQSGTDLRPVVAELAARAQEHLGAARRHRRAIPAPALAALLHAPLLDAHLRRLERAGYDPFARVRTRPAALAPLELLCRHALGRF